MPQAAHNKSKSFSLGSDCGKNAFADLRFFSASHTVTELAAAGAVVGFAEGRAVGAVVGGGIVGAAVGIVGGGAVSTVAEAEPVEAGAVGKDGLHPSSKLEPASAVADAARLRKARRLRRRPLRLPAERLRVYDDSAISYLP